MRGKKEFRIGDYVHCFEKSLNYLAGAILAILAAGIGYIASEPSQNISLLEMLQNIYDDPRETICVFMAVLSALPYYVYYTIKENLAWNADNGKRDHLELLKIGILYEICIMSFLYLLFQGDTHYTCFKMVVSMINIVLIGIYFCILVKTYKRELHIGYFFMVLIAVFLVFIILNGKSIYRLKTGMDAQNDNLIPLVLIFFFNTIINTIFLIPASRSTAETGIISNRIKIMIPIISMSIFTVTVVYCFLHFDQDVLIMISAAVWITLYEIVISCIKCRNSRRKVVWCIISFVIFVAAIPAVIYRNKSLPCELAIDWLILIGVGIYCAAIKYWGYILKSLFISKPESKSRLMNIMVWYRNSILGSMLFILAVLLPSGRFPWLLLTIIFCSLVSECYISKYIFSDSAAMKGCAYTVGRIIEFLAIILPVAVFALERSSYIKWEPTMECRVPLKAGIEVCIAGLAVVLILGYALRNWREYSFKISWPFDRKEVWQALTEAFASLKSLLGTQVSRDKNVGNFETVLVSWSVYIVLAGCYLSYFPFVSKKRMAGLVLVGIVVAFDWFSLTCRLLDYYIDRMKEGTKMVLFKKIFDAKWKECLGSLNEFKEIKAKQFYTGDRLRPILFFLGSSYGRHGTLDENDYNMIAETACSLELIHKSSVIFDDYIDQDTLRKGKDTFHVQYASKSDDNNRRMINVLILLGNAMLAKAQINFANCKGYFKCDDAAAIENMKRLSEMVKDLCLGCYKEISLAKYSHQSMPEIQKIIELETVSLIKGSLSLGYRCFHEEQGNRDGETIEELGQAFGNVFQYLNDLEPFSHRNSYEQHKGEKTKMNYTDKNVAMLKLYQKVTGEEKDNFYQNSYEEIIDLYTKYNIEQDVLEDVTKEIEKIKIALENLSVGNEDWVKEFTSLFNLAISKKKWTEQIANL